MNKIFNELLERFPCLECCSDEIISAFNIMKNGFLKGGKLLCCGNGGSAADCEHIVGELMKGFLSARTVTDADIPEDLRENLQGSLPAISLPSQSAIISAFSNDVAPDMVYAQLTLGYGQKNDLLIGISTSGNSKNIVNAVRVAKAKGLKTIALTGKKESMLSSLCDVTIKAPETETFKVQEYHLPIYHYLCAEVEKQMF